MCQNYSFQFLAIFHQYYVLFEKANMRQVNSFLEMLGVVSRVSIENHWQSLAKERCFEKSDRRHWQNLQKMLVVKTGVKKNLKNA